MAQEQPGSAGAVGGQVRVAIRDLAQAGQQVRAQALNLENQVINPLNTVETSHGATWTSGSHAEYLRVHQGLVASLGQAQQTTHHMGATMEQSAGAYGVLNQTRFNNAPGLPGDGADPFDTIRVAGQKPGYTQQQIEQHLLQAEVKATGKSLYTPAEAQKVAQDIMKVDATGQGEKLTGAEKSAAEAKIQALNSWRNSQLEVGGNKNGQTPLAAVMFDPPYAGISRITSGSPGEDGLMAPFMYAGDDGSARCAESKAITQMTQAMDANKQLPRPSGDGPITVYLSHQSGLAPCSSCDVYLRWLASQTGRPVQLFFKGGPGDDFTAGNYYRYTYTP